MRKKLFTILLALAGVTGLMAQDGAAQTTKETFKFNGRVQARAVTGGADSKYSGGSDYDTLDFNFRRIRLTFEYDKEWYGAKIDIKGENLLTSTKSSIQEANIWYKLGFLDTKFTVGQFAIPFLRELMASSGRLIVVERAYSTDMPDSRQQLDIGAMLAFNPLASMLQDQFLISLALTNGDGSGSDSIGQGSAELADKTNGLASLFNWRVQFNPIGKIVADGQEIFDSAMLLSIAAGGLHTQREEYRSLNNQLDGYTFDATFSVAGLYINGEYTFFVNNTNKEWSTYQATLGYNIPVGGIYVMPVVRYTYYQASTDGNTTIDNGESETSIWVGANLFLDKHNNKIQAFYRIVQDTAGTNGADLSNNELYIQFQANFGKKL